MNCMCVAYSIWSKVVAVNEGLPLGDQPLETVDGHRISQLKRQVNVPKRIRLSPEYNFAVLPLHLGIRQ